MSCQCKPGSMAGTALSSASGRSLMVTLGALTGGLLSSSCCLLQLVLNYTSIGCAGFSVLTPYRHYFRALTGSLIAYLLYSQGLNRHTVTTLAMCTGLMVSQDVLSAHNKGQLQQGVQQLLQHVRARVKAAVGAKQQQQQLPPVASRTKLHVKGMRCEGCASRLRGNLASVEGVDSCQVTFSEGVVEVWSNSTQQVDVSKLVQAVKQTDDSYVVYVVSRDCFDAQEHQQPCPKTAAAAGHAGSSEEL